MEVVCDSIDNCLGVNDKYLVVEILKMFKGDTCMDCGIVDTLHTRWICKHCYHKKKVNDQIRDVLSGFQMHAFFDPKNILYHRQLSKKLSRHLFNVMLNDC